MILNWLRNKVCAFIWPNIPFNISTQVVKMLDAKTADREQRLNKWMEESEDQAREAVKARAKEYALLERQVIALEKLVQSNG
jgi:hypothetical protein